jgi:hypothetical protein
LCRNLFIIVLVLVSAVTLVLLFVGSVRFARKFGCSRQSFAACLAMVRCRSLEFCQSDHCCFLLLQCCCDCCPARCRDVVKSVKMRSKSERNVRGLLVIAPS